MNRMTSRPRMGGIMAAVLVACLIAFLVPAAYAQTGTSVDACAVNPSLCEEASRRATMLIIGTLIVFGAFFGGIIFFLRPPSKKSLEDSRAKREADMLSQQAQRANQEAHDLARAAALAVQANQGMANSTNGSVKIRGRVGGVEVTIETNKSSREEAEANTLGRLAGPMSNYTEL